MKFIVERTTHGPMLRAMPTTSTTLVRDLKRSLIERGVAKPAGLTVADFFSSLTELGIRPTDYLSSIEYGIAASGTGHVVAELDEHTGGWEVREI